MEKNDKIHCLPDASAREGREKQPPRLGFLQALTADRPEQQTLAGFCASLHQEKDKIINCDDVQ